MSRYSEPDMGLLFNMGYIKTLEIQDEKNLDCKLRIFLNYEDRIYIETGDLDMDELSYKGFVTLDKSDALALIEELQRLVSEIQD